MRGLKTPTLNFRAFEVFGFPVDKFAFSVLFVFLDISAVFLTSTLKMDLASLLNQSAKGTEMTDSMKT